MTQVLIQPVFGNPDGCSNWKDTVQRPVDFGSPDKAAVLTGTQLATLRSVHRTGHAQFWGVTANQDPKAARVRQRDLVLFTGNNFALAAGRVGFAFRNKELADLLWRPHPERGSWLNLYTILGLEPLELPYDVLRGLPHFPSGHRFMGFEILKPDAAVDVLAYLGIEPDSAGSAERELAERLVAQSVEGLTRAPDAGRFLDIEGSHTPEGEYERSAGKIQFRRVESRLVLTYAETLNGFVVKRYEVASGLMNDLHLIRPDGTVELVEAKGKAGHDHVRAALAQLLDYAPHLETPADVLSALFPIRPSDDGVALLHRYGIDVIYHDGNGGFRRDAAPADCRASMRPNWTRKP